MRVKVPNELKKKSISVKIDANLVDLFDKYVVENKIKNKSKFIEELIVNELKNKNI